MKKKIAIQTLGCKLNFSESSTFSRLFKKRNYDTVDFDEKADIYIINTCSVTAIADKKSRYAIRHAHRTNKRAKVVVTGCLTSLQKEEIEQIEGVSMAIGNEDKSRLVNLVLDDTTDNIPLEHTQSFSPAYSIDDRTRSFLKVQDGCDYSCTYCTIPKARGKSRNAPIEKIIEQANEIAQKGAKEIVLTGINVGDFGRSTDEKFFDLVKALDKVDGIERIRISSIEPNLLSEDIIRFVADSEKLMPHFHIPLQAGTDEVLRLMKRRYNTSLFRGRVETIKKMMPKAFIAADIIAGSNGETEKLFRQGVDFINSLPLSRLHVFTYSERPNTEALDIALKTDVAERRERSKILQKLGDQKYQSFCQGLIGEKAKILIEKPAPKKSIGFSENYIKTEVLRENIPRNTVVSVKFEDFDARRQMMIATI